MCLRAFMRTYHTMNEIVYKKNTRVAFQIHLATRPDGLEPLQCDIFFVRES